MIWHMKPTPINPNRSGRSKKNQGQRSRWFEGRVQTKVKNAVKQNRCLLGSTSHLHPQPAACFSTYPVANSGFLSTSNLGCQHLDTSTHDSNSFAGRVCSMADQCTLRLMRVSIGCPRSPPLTDPRQELNALEKSDQLGKRFRKPTSRGRVGYAAANPDSHDRALQRRQCT